MLLEIFYFHVNIQIPFRFYRKTKNNRFNHAFVDSDGSKSKELKKKEICDEFFCKNEISGKILWKITIETNSLLFATVCWIKSLKTRAKMYPVISSNFHILLNIYF